MNFKEYDLSKSLNCFSLLSSICREDRREKLVVSMKGETKTMESQAIQIALDFLTTDDYKKGHEHTPKWLKKHHIYAVAKRAKKQLKVIKEPKYLLFHVDTTIGEYCYRCLYPQNEKDLLQELNERLGSDYKTVWEFQQSPEYAQEYVILEVML